MIGSSVATTITGAAALMFLLFWATLRPYRHHYALTQSDLAATPVNAGTPGLI
jgi:hypothetical protein